METKYKINMHILEAFNRERGVSGRPKVIRGSNVLVLTSHAGLNPCSKHASLSLTASLAALRAGYEREARVIHILLGQ